MLVKLSKIGNSLGVRLPKSIITACEFGSEIELTVHNKKVTLSAVQNPRHDWDEKLSNARKKPGELEGEWLW